MADAQAEAKAEEEAAAKLEADAAQKGEAEKAAATKAATEQAEKVAAEKKAEAEKKVAAKKAEAEKKAAAEKAEADKKAAAEKAEADKKASKEKKLLAKAEEMAADPEEAKFPTDWIKNDVKFNVDETHNNREDAVEAAVRPQATWKTSTEGWFLQTKAFLLRRWGQNAPGPA